MAECCCCPESRHSDSRSHMINCFLVGTGTSWLWLGQGLPPSLTRRVCVCARERERGWWKAKTAKERERECYVLFYELVCHWTPFLNICYCFEPGHTAKWWGFWLNVVKWSMWIEGTICPATFLCWLELDCEMLKVYNGLFPAIVSHPLCSCDTDTVTCN